MFVMFDKEGNGQLTQTEMQQVMAQTKLDKKVCAKVWQLCNPKLETVFNKTMFITAMHLMFRKREDPNVQIPDQLPIELSVSASENENPMP